LNLTIEVKLKMKDFQITILGTKIPKKDNCV
jgi:hypothetical protein